MHVDAGIETQNDLHSATGVPSNALEQADLQIVVDGDETTSRPICSSTRIRISAGDRYAFPA